MGVSAHPSARPLTGGATIAPDTTSVTADVMGRSLVSFAPATTVPTSRVTISMTARAAATGLWGLAARRHSADLTAQRPRSPATTRRADAVRAAVRFSTAR